MINLSDGNRMVNTMINTNGSRTMAINFPNIPEELNRPYKNRVKKIVLKSVKKNLLFEQGWISVLVRV